jgi:hypothetical protein
LCDAIAAEIDAVVGEPVSAGPVGVGVRLCSLVADQVGGVPERRLYFRAVEPYGAIDAPVADENDGVLAGVPAHLVKGHVRMTRAALEDKIGSPG